jgi:uncharacterized protein (TIGR02118 family)
LRDGAAIMVGSLAAANGQQMVKLVILLHRRADLTVDEFERYWREIHAPIAAQLPGLRKYVQGYRLPVTLPFPATHDAVAELWFDSVEALAAAMDSPQERAAAADAANFIDLARTSMVVVTERSVAL